MEWTSQHRESLYHIIEAARIRPGGEPDIDAWEEWLAGLGIKWAELDDNVNDAPPGTVAIWEGPGFWDESRKQCWVVPDDVALKLLVLT